MRWARPSATATCRSATCCCATSRRSTTTRSASRRRSGRGSRPRSATSSRTTTDRSRSRSRRPAGYCCASVCCARIGLVSLGQTRLLAMLRRRVPGVKTVTGERLVTAATVSVRSAPPEPVAAVLADRLSALVAELEVHESTRRRSRRRSRRSGRSSRARRVTRHRRGRVGHHALQSGAARRSDRPARRLREQASALALRRDESARARERAVQGADSLEQEGAADAAQGARPGRLPRPARRPACSGARYAERRERMVEQKARVAAMRKLLASSGASIAAPSPSTRPASTCARASTRSPPSDPASPTSTDRWDKPRPAPPAAERTDNRASSLPEPAFAESFAVHHRALRACGTSSSLGGTLRLAEPIGDVSRRSRAFALRRPIPASMARDRLG